MTLWKTFALLTVLIALAPPLPAAEPMTQAKEGAGLEAALHRALTNPAERAAFRIEASGQLAQDLHFLTLYGRGVGFWNKERQFQLDPSQVKKSIRVILDHHLCRLPETIGGEEEAPEIIRGRPAPPHKRGDAPRYLLRTLTVTVGERSRTIVQEADVPEAKPLEKGLAELASLCRGPAAKGVTAHDLANGLALVASGKLAPEALILSVNAPQLRSLKDNTGQGWILRIEHGRIVAQSQALGSGYLTIVDRPLEPREIQKLAKELLTAGVASLPAQVNTPGYLHLNLRVLGNAIQVMARTYAGTPSPEAANSVSTFASIRNLLRSTWKREAELGEASSRPTS